MISISSKSKRSITESLDSFRSNTFDENTVKLLLIDLRDVIGPQQELKEICHFIAHPERNEGLFCDKILSRYYRYKYTQELFSKLEESKIRLDTTFNDLLEEAIDYSIYDSIDKKYFQTVFITGLNDFDDEFYKNMLGSTKNKVQELINRSYKKVNGRYELRYKSNKDIKHVLNILHTSIQFNSVLDENVLMDQLITTVQYFFDICGLNNTYTYSIQTYSTEIFLCIMCLLHDKNFLNNQDIVGNSFLSSIKDKLYLCCESQFDNKKLQYILLSSKASSKQFIDTTKYSIKDFKPLPCFSIKRADNGILNLV